MRISVLISGGGTTLKNLIEYHQRGELDVEFATVVSNNPKAGGLSFAADYGIESSVVKHRDFSDDQTFADAVFEKLVGAETEIVVMGGFLRKLLIPTAFTNKVINIHPSLIPSFCGKGFYGKKVHQAVIDYGCKLSGCTVHFVDNQYDHGPIIAQSSVEVATDDTAASLASRVFEAECQLYPKVINALAAGQVKIDGRQISWT